VGNKIRSDLVAVYGTPCAIPPHNGNNNIKPLGYTVVRSQVLRHMGRAAGTFSWPRRGAPLADRHRRCLSDYTQKLLGSPGSRGASLSATDARPPVTNETISDHSTMDLFRYSAKTVGDMLFTQGGN
jgi:hypothetical protein